MLTAAREYLTKYNFSIVPIQPSKKPYIRWADFQNRYPTREELDAWWGKWPDAMIGIVTGRISNLCVIDVDTEEGKDRINEILPDTFIAPTVRTPRGGEHYYCQYSDGLTNNAGSILGCDLRAEGGYIVAPPSCNGNGNKYRWLDGLHLNDIEIPSLPAAYIKRINKHCESKKTIVSDHTGPHQTTGDHRFFTQGRRDDDLFTVAHSLLKEGLTESFARHVLDIMANNCVPPFSPKEAQTKIDSALNRIARMDRNIAQEVREWALTTTGHFMTTDCHRELHLTTKGHKKAANMALIRMVEEDLIERSGDRRGCYRVVDSSCEAMDFINVNTETMNLHLPFNLHDYVEFYPGNIILIAGEPNSGKTAFLINVIKENMYRYEIHYFNSEMGGSEFNKRLRKFEDMKITDWNFKAWERSDNFSDVIKSGKGKLNIIDFLEIHDNFYEVGGILAAIHKKLKGALAIVAIQKNPGTDTGLGGFRTLEKPRLALAMRPGSLKIVKAKNWKTSNNPNGLEFNFKLVQGCKFSYKH